MTAYDPRVTPARGDLAAKHLAGTVTATRYVEGRLYDVVAAQAPVRSAPRSDAPLATEALKGERVTIYDTDTGGWAWGQLGSDDYVGWLPADALAPASAAPTHKVTALRTLAFPSASIKSPPLEGLPFGAKIVVSRHEDRMAVTNTGTYVPAAHLAPIDVTEKDFVAVAERFIGTPYLWGGKTSLGIDCSGLVQVALAASGLACPRDSDMQETAFGAPVAAEADLAGLQRGDLVFWKGHVAIVCASGYFLHANAFHMAVAIEPIADAIARIRRGGSAVTGVRFRRPA